MGKNNNDISSLNALFKEIYSDKVTTLVPNGLYFGFDNLDPWSCPLEELERNVRRTSNRKNAEILELRSSKLGQVLE